MRDCFKTGGEPDQVVAGENLIAIVLASYIFMHVFFFGSPGFTLSTAVGIAEIVMAVCTIAVAGIGALSIQAGMRKRTPRQID